MIELEFNYVSMCDMKDNLCASLKVSGIECSASVYQCLCLITVFQKCPGHEYFTDAYNLHHFFFFRFTRTIYLFARSFQESDRSLDR